MITALTLISIVGAVLLIFACYRADWKAIDEQNRQFYVDGYHIYYDRKILRQKEVEHLKQKNNDCNNRRKTECG